MAELEVFVEEPIALPSDRNFGFLFVVVFLVVAISLYRHGQVAYWAFAGLAAITLLVALLRPGVLHPGNRAWMAFGLLLSKIVTPIVLGILFLVVFSPIGLIMRAFGRDAMRRKLSPSARTYWIARSPPGPDPQSLREQG